MDAKTLLAKIQDGAAAEAGRYAALIEGFLDPKHFPHGEYPEVCGNVRFFTAAGRTELGGNHTDHNQGKVLAASIQLDMIAIAAPRSDKRVFFRSEGFPPVSVDLNELSAQAHERGKTAALVRGIAAQFAARGVTFSGFTANAASNVLPGSGLSSSATVEVLLAKIFDCFYARGDRSALELAQIGQKAENEYFGKPCGLMDQVACAQGGVVAIDFKDKDNPQVSPIDFDLASMGYALCVVNTRSNHAFLTSDYAAIPAEMHAIARFFGAAVLRETNREAVLAHIAELRKTCGDRAVLRALHFFDENDRVDAMRKALESLNTAASSAERKSALSQYLNKVSESGNSSWELLQNSYSPKTVQDQGLCVALALTRSFGAARVHGGGFAGTIQAYIPLDRLAAYTAAMEAVFAAGAVTPLCIRPVGVAELYF